MRTLYQLVSITFPFVHHWQRAANGGGGGGTRMTRLRGDAQLYGTART
jgi:hypothetical protein